MATLVDHAMLQSSDADGGPEAMRSSGISAYYESKIRALEVQVRKKTENLRRLEAQRNELNGRVKDLR